MSAQQSGAPARVAISQVLLGLSAALALLFFLRDILVPFFVALIIIALIDGLVRALARTWPAGPRWALIILTGIIIVAVLLGCVGALVYGGAQLVEQGPALVARLDRLIAEMYGAVGAADPPHLAELVSAEAAMSVARPVVTGLGSLMASATLVVLFMGFMLASRALMAQKLKILAGGPDRAAKLRRVLEKIANGAGDYMWVQTVTGAIYAIACGVTFAIIGLQNPLFWTVVIFLLSFIPVLGAGVASIAPALFALIQFPTYWPAIAVFVAVQVFASIVGNLILPMMQADKQNIDPTISIFSIALWTLLWGVPGAFLAIPLTVMLMVVFDQFDETRWVAVLISNDGEPNAV